jgi:hypothetical protein
MRYRKFVISCSTFGAFEHIGRVTNNDDLNTLVMQVISALRHKLKECHLDNLVEKLDSMSSGYHIHTVTMAQILQDTDDVVYVCHCPIKFH